jgi:hypothetical protein
MTADIYALYSTEDGRVRYVGESILVDARIRRGCRIRTPQGMVRQDTVAGQAIAPHVPEG